MREWVTETPDGRRLAVHRESLEWVVRCGEAGETRSTLLDIALINAIRRDADVAAHSRAIDYGAWTRLLAHRIESDVCPDPEQTSNTPR